MTHNGRLQIGVLAALTVLFSTGAASAGTVDSSSFTGAAGSTAISTTGLYGYGYVDTDATVFRGMFGGTGTSGDPPITNLLFGSITEYNADYTYSSTSLTEVGGYSNVTVTEGAPSNVIDSRIGASDYTFDGNASYGAIGGFGGNEQDIFTLTFNDLGVGTFDITLYMDHSVSSRIFDMDYTLTGAVPGTTSMGTQTINNLNDDVAGATAFTYNIRVTTTAATDDLSLTFGGKSGGSGTAYLAGYTVASPGSSGPADPKITAFSVSGTTATVTMSGDDTVGYWCASSTDLAGFTTTETALQTGTVTPVPTNLDGSFNTSGGVLTFDVDVTGDSALFLRIQDADPGS